MADRFPDYDVLAKRDTPSWNPQTRKVIDERIATAEPEVLTPEQRATLRRVVGREGDPAAFVSIRSWIGPGVQLWLDDPEDPTPYWVVSTRHPQRVVQLLRSGG